MKTEIFEITDTRTIRMSRLIARQDARMAYTGDTILVGQHLWKIIDVLIADQVQVINVKRFSDLSCTETLMRVTGDLYERLGVKLK